MDEVVLVERVCYSCCDGGGGDGGGGDGGGGDGDGVWHLRGNIHYIEGYWKLGMIST
jgi:hypothetical protein